MEEAVAAADVVLISESVSSGGMRMETAEIETPMGITKAWGWDEMGLTLGNGGGGTGATLPRDPADAAKTSASLRGTSQTSCHAGDWAPAEENLVHNTSTRHIIRDYETATT